MKKELGLLVFSISVLTIVSPALAEEFTQSTVLTFLFKDIFGFTQFSPTFNFFIFSFILPLSAIIVVVAAFLKELQIFRRATRYQWALAIIIGLFTLPTQGLAVFVQVTSQAIGFWSWAIFVIMFFVGTIFHLAIRARGWQSGYSVETAAVHATQELDERIRAVNDEQRILTERFQTAGMGGMTPDQYNAAMSRLDTERANLTARIRELRRRTG